MPVVYSVTITLHSHLVEVLDLPNFTQRADSMFKAKGKEKRKGLPPSRYAIIVTVFVVVAFLVLVFLLRGPFIERLTVTPTLISRLVSPPPTMTPTTVTRLVIPTSTMTDTAIPDIPEAAPVFLTLQAAITLTALPLVTLDGVGSAGPTLTLSPTIDPPTTMTLMAAITGTSVVAQLFGDLRIRAGPGDNYPIIAQAKLSNAYLIVGVSDDGNWLLARFFDYLSPDGTQLQGWVARGQGQNLSSDSLSLVPVIYLTQAPLMVTIFPMTATWTPLPTFTRTQTPSPTPT
jgi:hypothetical protein